MECKKQYTRRYPGPEEVLEIRTWTTGNRSVQPRAPQASQVSTPTPVLSQSSQSNGVPLIRRFVKFNNSNIWFEYHTQTKKWRCWYESNWSDAVLWNPDTFSINYPPFPEVSMSGYNPDDLQCCDASSNTVRVYKNGRYHAVGCSIFVPDGSTSVIPTCEHKYVQYTGLNETFKYCTKCDEKLRA